MKNRQELSELGVSIMLKERVRRKRWKEKTGDSFSYREYKKEIFSRRKEYKRRLRKKYREDKKKREENLLTSKLSKNELDVLLLVFKYQQDFDWWYRFDEKIMKMSKPKLHQILKRLSDRGYIVYQYDRLNKSIKNIYVSDDVPEKLVELGLIAPFEIGFYDRVKKRNLKNSEE